jgi:formylmethanofuran dehydrogenase subunit E
MINSEVKCNDCGDMVSAHTARIIESNDGGNGLEDFHYLCPVCVITAKNAMMQRQLLESVGERNRLVHA